jgi:hypothetical protein
MITTKIIKNGSDLGFVGMLIQITKFQDGSFDEQVLKCKHYTLEKNAKKQVKKWFDDHNKTEVA